jgi:RNA polymerase sigma-70 factor (ECF subfamily)
LAAVPELGRAAGVERRIAPEAAATHDLYERYSRQIYGFCLHQLGNREEAEDAVQTTFLNAFRGLSRGISPDAESAWLYKIAHNVCLTRRRSSYRRGRVETPGDMQALQDFVAAPQRMGADELIELQEALAAMPSSQRKAILLREWRGLSYREIADEMDLSQAAVETLIFRARRSLAQGLEQAPPERKKLLQRLRHAADVGSLVATLKAMLAGGAAVKAVAAAAAVSATAGAVAAVPSDERVPRRAHIERPAATVVQDRPAAASQTPRLDSRDVPDVGAIASRDRAPHPAKATAPVKKNAATSASRAAVAPVVTPETAPALAEASAPPPVVEQPAPAPAPEQRSQPAAADPPSAAPAREEKAESKPEVRKDESKAGKRRDEPKAEQPRDEPPRETSSRRAGKAETPKHDSPKGSNKEDVLKFAPPAAAAPQPDASTQEAKAEAKAEKTAATAEAAVDAPKHEQRTEAPKKDEAAEVAAPAPDAAKPEPAKHEGKGKSGKD